MAQPLSQTLGGLIRRDHWDLHYAQPQMMQISLEIAAKIRPEQEVQEQEQEQEHEQGSKGSKGNCKSKSRGYCRLSRN